MHLLFSGSLCWNWMLSIDTPAMDVSIVYYREWDQSGEANPRPDSPSWWLRQFAGDALSAAHPSRDHSRPPHHSVAHSTPRCSSSLCSISHTLPSSSSPTPFPFSPPFHQLSTNIPRNNEYFDSFLSFWERVIELMTSKFKAAYKVIGLIDVVGSVEVLNSFLPCTLSVIVPVGWIRIQNGTLMGQLNEYVHGLLAGPLGFLDIPTGLI